MASHKRLINKNKFEINYRLESVMGHTYVSYVEYISESNFPYVYLALFPDPHPAFPQYCK